MNSLMNLTYASRASELFQEHEIPELLQRARVANAKQAITGMLLYIGGSFLQVLEGQPTIVDAAFSRILEDTRHTRVTLIGRQSLAARAFEGWTMMHKTLDPLEAGELIGEVDFFASPTWVPQLDAARANKLLAAASVQWQMERRTGRYRTLGARTA